MFSPSPRNRVLLLGRPNPESGLLRWLQVLFPEQRFEAAGVRFAEWLPYLQATDLGGLVVWCAGLNRLDQGALEAWLEMHPLPTLAYFGDRGGAGYEQLLQHTSVHGLHDPVTMEALETLTRPSPAAEAADEDKPQWLGGVVEGLRDPLTSLSGYLELVRSEHKSPFLDAAGRAVDDLERLLDAFSLAASPRVPRPSNVLIREAAESAARDAWPADREPRMLVEPDLEMHVDRRLLEAALFASGLFLSRFGPQGAPELRGSRDGSALDLLWSLPTPEAAPAGTAAPPDLLPRVLEALADRLDADPILDRVRGVVPYRAGLHWATAPSRR